MDEEKLAEIYKAINDVSNKINDISYNMDRMIQQLNSITEKRIEKSTLAIDDIADMIATHNEAIDSLAEIVAEESEVE